MSWVAVAVAGGAVVGAVVSSNGAKHAANTQANAARDASGVQWNIFQQTNRNQQPYIQAGYGASDVLSRLLGIRPTQQGTSADRFLPGGTNSTAPAGSMTGIRIGGPNDAGVRLHPNFQVSGSPGGSSGTGDTYIPPMGPARGRVGNMISNVVNNVAQQNHDAIDLSRGLDGSYSLGDSTGLPDGYLTQTFGPQQFLEGIDPGYGWRFQQGLQGVMNGAAPAIGSLSGPALKALVDYGQGAASQEYGAAFDRFQTQQGNIFQRLSSIASLGQNAAANVGNQGVVTGGNIGANIVGAGNAAAAGQIATANAWSNAAGTLASIPYLRQQNGGG